jgi:hypothetical protein
MGKLKRPTIVAEWMIQGMPDQQQFQPLASLDGGIVIGVSNLVLGGVHL